MRILFDHLSKEPERILTLSRGTVQDLLRWNDPDGDYDDLRGEQGYMTDDDLRIALLIQLVNSR